MVTRSDGTLRAASRSLRTHADDERPREVGQPVVPTKPPNKAGRPAAEGVEGRGLAKGNPRQQNTTRTQGREDVQSALERIRQAARRDKKVRFTALLHHVYDVEHAARGLLRAEADAAPGVDGETWRHYGEELEANLQDLSARLQRGAYRAKPVRRVYIPKADGRQRPLGVPALEDKIVQRATVEVLNAIYETDFSASRMASGPGAASTTRWMRSTSGLLTKKVNWVLDVDIRGFFDAIDHGWL